MGRVEEHEPRNCVVCGDRATGYHFHALTCEGCKGFFRRTVSKTIAPICPFAGSCVVSKAQRRHCPACRLQKCLNAGMRKDMILSAEALALRRARQAQRRAQQTSIQLSKEQKELIQILLEAHTRHMGTVFDQFVNFRVSRIWAGKLPKGYLGRCPEGEGYVPSSDRGQVYRTPAWASSSIKNLLEGQ